MIYSVIKSTEAVTAMNGMHLTTKDLDLQHIYICLPSKDTLKVF